MDRITYDGNNINEVMDFFGASDAIAVVSGSNERFNLQPMNFIVRVGESFVNKGNGRIVFDDKVNHPSHYGSGTYEVINVIEAWGLCFPLGNVLKYIARAGKKNDELEDLKKAQWYLERKIKQLESGNRYLPQ